MKRYQVFISSTYIDLKKERAEVLKGVLKSNCFPAGMELFPSASLDQFEYIKRVIDVSDYYILIIGGRYGDDSMGLSYTELEFDYADSMGIPILAFLHQNPEDIPAKYYELDTAKREKLQKFRRKVEKGRLVNYWTTAEELGLKVYSSLQNEIAFNPRRGWEQALDTSNIDLYKETIKLKHLNQELSEKLNKAQLALAEKEAKEFALNEDFWKQHVRLSGLYKDSTGTNISYNELIPLRLLFSLWYPYLLEVSLDIEAKERLSKSIAAHFGLYEFQITSSCYHYIKSLLAQSGIIAEFSSRKVFLSIDNIVLTKAGKQIWNNVNQ